MDQTTTTLPQLTPEEQRVLGALMEKSRTTPEYYPLTVNSLLAACNQKTSRNPVVNYDEDTILITLDQLRKRGLVSTATGGSSRVKKYKHNLAIVYPIVPAQVAILCLLLLRGPLTRGEINNASARLFEFESLDEVQSYLDQLADGEQPFVVQLPKQPGQKEARYAHLLGETPAFESVRADSGASVSHGSDLNALSDRVAQLEDELAKLREEFDQLMEQLT